MRRAGALQGQVPAALRDVHGADGRPAGAEEERAGGVAGGGGRGAAEKGRGGQGLGGGIRDSEETRAPGLRSIRRRGHPGARTQPQGPARQVRGAVQQAHGAGAVDRDRHRRPRDQF